MRQWILLGLLCQSSLLVSQTPPPTTSNNKKNIEYVNPFVGTGAHGHTFPGATTPFGMVQLSPDTRTEGWDACAGYHYSDNKILGFSHTHLSGTGVGDYCDVLLLPTTEDLIYSSSLTPDGRYWFDFKKENEKASAGYYSVLLHEPNILAELTATKRVGFHRYTYKNNDNKFLLTLNLDHYDKTLEKAYNRESDTEISGKRISQGWAKEQHIYFWMRFSDPIEIEYEAVGKGAVAFLFNANSKKQLLVKVGISAVSIENAKENLDKELGGWDFDSTRIATENEWSKYLDRINITASEQVKENFYTALYHTLIAPNIFQDVNGDYRGLDGKTHNSKTFNYHTVFSLWDTYRAAHPLFTIVCPEKVPDFINSMLDDFDKTRHLPVWPLAGNETWCMIGNHAIPVIADAYLKGFRGFDTLQVLEAMIHSVDTSRFGLKEYSQFGYIPAENESESVSKTLEYAYDDWCIAQVAKAMGKEDIYLKYITRCQNYQNVFDHKTGFFRAKLNQQFIEPFRPDEVNSHFTEANAWQYAFAPVHDLDGFLRLVGGRERLGLRLDSLFAADTATTGRKQDDITGLIGQYAHGNEPSHHIAYLYNVVNQPWKAQQLIKKIMSQFYAATPEGLIGNEDCGQMSAWYVLSALGFYPLNPCGEAYQVGHPMVSKATIEQPNGKLFSLDAEKLVDSSFYLTYIMKNDTLVSQSFLRHSDITSGKRLSYRSTQLPKNVFVYSMIMPTPMIDSAQRVLAVPYVVQGSRSFADSVAVTLAHPTNATIYYTINGKEPSISDSTLYTKPIILKNTSTIRFKAILPWSKPSPTIAANFVKIPFNYNISLATKYAPQYAAGGDRALVDGLRGGKNYHTGGWQGYSGADVVATVDMGEAKNINKAGITFLQDQNAWIFYPTEVQFYGSEDGITYKDLGIIENELKQSDSVATKTFIIEKAAKVRFVKVVAKNVAVIPRWHKGKGGSAWLFSDEIEIE